MGGIKIKDYEVSPTDSYVFDTNVWIFIFGPIAGSNLKQQMQYAQLFQDIQSRGATIFITSLIISEFINAVLRINFANWKIQEDNVNADFKHDYRPTAHYKNALAEIKENVKIILNHTQKRNDDFREMSFISLHRFLDNNCDYNDAYLLKYCIENKLHIVSDDKDITQQDVAIKVITA